MRYVIILLLGLIVGAGAAVFLLGTPRAKSMPGTQVQAPEASKRGSELRGLDLAFWFGSARCHCAWPWVGSRCGGRSHCAARAPWLFGAKLSFGD